jgi:hypothetical protein
MVNFEILNIKFFKISYLMLLDPNFYIGKNAAKYLEHMYVPTYFLYVDTHLAGNLCSIKCKYKSTVCAINEMLYPGVHLINGSTLAARVLFRVYRSSHSTYSI